MAPPDDGVSEVSVSLPGEEEMDAGIEKVLDQGFAETHRRLTHGAQRLQDANDNVSEQTKLGYLTEQRVVGVREAKASSMLHPVYGQPVSPGNGGAKPA
jgi:hypothetical protein